MTASAGEALSTAFAGLFDLFDEVIVPDPGFVSCAPAVLLALGRPIGMPSFEKSSFVPSSGCDVTYHERITRDTSEFTE